LDEIRHPTLSKCGTQMGRELVCNVAQNFRRATMLL
jgi:hypothetical protein